MKKIYHQMKPGIKITGLILGLFVLWIIFDSLSTPGKDFKQNFGKNLTGSSVNSVRQDSSPRTSSTLGIMKSPGIRSQKIEDTVNLVTEKRIIKNGNLKLKVENTEKAVSQIQDITKQQNGKISSTNIYEKVKDQKSGVVTVKVPVKKFQKTIDQIKKVATQIISESTDERDTTERYIDLEAQLKNKRAEEKSFIKILNQSGEIDDVLAVTQQISRVRGEIERLEAQVRFLESQTEMSTITITLSEDVEIAPIKSDWRPGQVIKKAFSDLINNIQNFVDEIIRFIIVGIPSLIPFLLFVWLVYWIGKKVWGKIRN